MQQTKQNKKVKGLPPRNKFGLSDSKNAKRKAARYGPGGTRINKKVVKPTYDESICYIEIPTTLVPTIQVACPFLTSSLQVAFASLASYIAQHGLLNIDTPTQSQSWDAVYGGLGYLLEATAKLIQNQAVDVDKLPSNVFCLIKALQAKEIKYKQGKISYSWNNFNTSIPLASLPFANGQWAPTYLTGDNDTYNSPVNIYAGGAQAQEYPRLLRILGGLTTHNKNLKIIPLDGTCNISSDASAFARGYVYNGQQSPSPAQSAYKDVENEVQIRAPMLANFCEYQIPDTRLPSDLKPYSGGPTHPMLAPLFSSFTSYYNKTPPVFNQIDVNEIFIVYSLYLVSLLESAARSGEVTETIPRTSQDVYVALCTCLLQLNPYQALGMFSGDVKFDNQTNCFVPLLPLGHNTGNSNFDALLVPTILAENINCLMSRSVIPQGATGKKINRLINYPVFGRYWLDELPSFQYKDKDGNLQDLYSSDVQLPINVTDYSTAPGVYVNGVGTYYQGTMADVNSVINKYQNRSVTVQPLVGDGGPKGMSLGFFTRYQETPLNEGAPPKVPRSVNDIYRIKNASPIRVDKVGIIPAASVTSLFTEVITSAIPINKEFKELIDTMILPVTRLNNTEDQLTLQMKQIATQQPISIAYQKQTTNFSGVGEFQRLNRYASYMVMGPGSAQGNKFSIIFDAFLKDGRGGVLSSILGGIATQIFPGAKGVIDTIASISPL